MGYVNPRIMVSISDKMYCQIEDYRHENRITTISKAAAQLISIGLKSIREEQENAQREPKPELDVEGIRNDLLEILNKLNPQGDQETG